jgi:hypothetical protein
VSFLPLDVISFSRERERARAGVKPVLHHPHLNPLPPKEGEEAIGSGYAQHKRKKDFRTGVDGFSGSFLAAVSSSATAETLEQSIAAAKKESELYFVAGPTTFGGKKGLADLEAAFNRKFGLHMRMRFSAGPEMNAMAARVITELKAGGKSSTDMYLGSLESWIGIMECWSIGMVEFGSITPIFHHSSTPL